MQAQQAILTFTEADRSLGARLLKIAIEIDRVEGYSEPHAIAIAWTAEKLGARMGLHGIDLTALKFAALAHDLGERAMKRNYLLRPGELSWEETLDLWRHPILGEQAAGELKLPRQTQLLIRWHHEWWNGGGYPDGLAGESIPPGARILRAVDSYFALISDRPHRRRFDRGDAEQIIADLAGIEFDPQVAKLLLQVLAEDAAEGGFVYPAPVADESAARPIEDQPQPIDEVVYARAYANRHAEVPAESLIGGQKNADVFASSTAPTQVPDTVISEIVRPETVIHDNAIPDTVGPETVIHDNAIDEVRIERRLETAELDLVPSETIDESAVEIRRTTAEIIFEPPILIEERALEIQQEIPGGDLALSEAPEEIILQGQLETVRDDVTPLDLHVILDEPEIENRTETPAVDFTAQEGPDKAGDKFQPEMAGVEISKTRDKKDEIES